MKSPPKGKIYKNDPNSKKNHHHPNPILNKIGIDWMGKEAAYQ